MSVKRARPHHLSRGWGWWWGHASSAWWSESRPGIWWRRQRRFSACCHPSLSRDGDSRGGPASYHECVTWCQGIIHSLFVTGKLFSSLTTWHASHIYIYGWIIAWNSQQLWNALCRSVLSCHMSYAASGLLLVTASVTLTKISVYSVSVLSLTRPHASHSAIRDF